MKSPSQNFLRTTILTSIVAGICAGCFLIPTQHSRHSPIHDFARDGNLALLIQDLSTNSSDLNLPDDAGLTPLHLAALHCHTNVIGFLLQKGAKVNRTAQDGTTPLHLAAQEGCIDGVTQLLRAGANVNIKDNQNRTALDRAEAWHQDAIIKLLHGYSQQN